MTLNYGESRDSRERVRVARQHPDRGDRKMVLPIVAEIRRGARRRANVLTEPVRAISKRRCSA